MTRITVFKSLYRHSPNREVVEAITVEEGIMDARESLSRLKNKATRLLKPYSIHENEKMDGWVKASERWVRHYEFTSVWVEIEEVEETPQPEFINTIKGDTLAPAKTEVESVKNVLKDNVITLAHCPRIDWIDLEGFTEVALIHYEAHSYVGSQNHRQRYMRDTVIASRWIKGYATSEKHGVKIKFRLRIDGAIEKTFDKAIDKLANIMTRVNNVDSLSSLPKSITRYLK